MLQFPILADPLSNLRNGEHDKRLIIDAYDSFLSLSHKKSGFETGIGPKRITASGRSASFISSSFKNESVKQKSSKSSRLPRCFSSRF
jgi:hypothetical protein